jgi:hypothetical protein
MSPPPLRALERAFALARSGDFAGVGAIRNQLRAEGFDATQVDGPLLLKQLRALIDTAKRRNL